MGNKSFNLAIRIGIILDSRDLVSQEVEGKKLEFFPLTAIPDVKAPIVLVCVGRPSRPDGAADLSHAQAARQWIREKAAGTVTVVLKSTVPPGTGSVCMPGIFPTGPTGFVIHPTPSF